MSKLNQNVICGELVNASQTLLELQDSQGKTSVAYQQGLTRVTRLWAILKMTRSQDEFLHDIIRQA